MNPFCHLIHLSEINAQSLLLKKPFLVVLLLLVVVSIHCWIPQLFHVPTSWQVPCLLPIYAPKEVDMVAVYLVLYFLYQSCASPFQFYLECYLIRHCRRLEALSSVFIVLCEVPH